MKARRLYSRQKDFEGLQVKEASLLTGAMPKHHFHFLIQDSRIVSRSVMLNFGEVQEKMSFNSL